MEPNDRQCMDEAAGEAKEELKKILKTNPESVELCNWVRKWFMKAGYKRLGRLLKEEAANHEN